MPCRFPRTACRPRVRRGFGRTAVTALAILGLSALAASGPPSSQAHELRPGYLELSATGEESWNILWKVPAKEGRRLDLDVRLPRVCETTEPVSRRAEMAYIERWRATCAGGLFGQSIAVDGLAGSRTDVLVRIKHLDGTSQTARLTANEPATTVSSSPSQFEVAVTYSGLGIEHILLGIDHLLFVLAVLFLVGSVRKLVAAITAFTVAHSLTLAAATLGWIQVPARPVEAAIALSIVFVAAEVLRGSDGLAASKPWLVTFAFGLLHGLGFAGALRDVGLPSHAIPVALAFFNIGVEAGQLLFIAAVLGLLKLVAVAPRFRLQEGKTGVWSVTNALAYPVSYSIGILGAFWLIERTASFWEIR
ncbi:MAG: HupE/UreJ family protein [Deltaproteobacteria bacterium]|nr:HupE/UreJ family protein [Deltaproteobacteria bacterium]